MIKPIPWKGNDLSGVWTVTRKLDGVRMLRDSAGLPVSRSGKPLHNLETIPGSIEDAEIFSSSWEESVSLVRTLDGRAVDLSCVYSLSTGSLDPRLFIKNVTDPSKEEIASLLEDAMSRGDEGLVLRKGSCWLKVKPFETYDVEITGIVEGTGKNLGKLGAFETSMGKVGVGFSDSDRSRLFDKSLIGSLIEVRCMSLTPSGKFRHPVFVRIRWDK